MTPSAEEIADGQKACERLEVFQRYTSPPGQYLVLLVVLAGFGVWDAFKRGGWKLAVGTGVFWLIIGGVSIYQYQMLRKQARQASILLEKLKSRYGESVYSDIQKHPHSAYYYIFQKRYPPFNRPSLKLP